MPNGQRQAISPRMARMMRELEGPPEEFAVAASSSASDRDGRRTPLAHERRVLASVLLLVGAAIVVAMVAMEAPALGDPGRHVAIGSKYTSPASH